MRNGAQTKCSAGTSIGGHARSIQMVNEAAGGARRRRTFFATAQVFDLPLIYLMMLARQTRRRRERDLSLKTLVQSLA
jgi:hypothetical protein